MQEHEDEEGSDSTPEALLVASLMPMAEVTGLRVCLTCAEWDDRTCDDLAARSEFSGQRTIAMNTCPYWTEIEVQRECQTCRHWVMARRARVCSNAGERECGLPMKPSENCPGWSEAPSVDYPVDFCKAEGDEEK